jgi:hypothetical protein
MEWWKTDYSTNLSASHSEYRNIKQPLYFAIHTDSMNVSLGLRLAKNDAYRGHVCELQVFNEVLLSINVGNEEVCHSW